MAIQENIKTIPITKPLYKSELTDIFRRMESEGCRVSWKCANSRYVIMRTMDVTNMERRSSREILVELDKVKGDWL